MRNPLKKIQKKINLRLASKATQQHQQNQRSNKNSPSPKKSSREESCTSLSQDQDDDPLFGSHASNHSHNKQALIDSRRVNQQQLDHPNNEPKKFESFQKKKRGGRLSFGGGRKSIGSVTKQGPLCQDKAEAQRELSLSPGRHNKVNPTTARKEEQAQAIQEEEQILKTPTKTIPEETPTQAPASPDSPSSNLHIPVPPVFQTPTKNRSEVPAIGNQSQMEETTNVITKRTSITRRKTPPPTTKEAKKQPPAIVDPNVERISKAAAALDNTGNEAFERGEYDKAMAIYAKALKLKKRTLTNFEQDVEDSDLPPEVNAALVNDAQTNTQKSPDSASKRPAAADELWISVATSINNIGYLRQQSGQASAEETMQAYQNSLKIKRRVLGKDNLSVGKTLNNLGTVHYLKREYKQALKAYQEALQIMKASLGSYHLDVGTVHSNIGDVYWAQSGDARLADEKACPQENYQYSRDAALRHYRHSLEIRWEQLQDHHDPKVIRLLEKIAALEMGESFLALVQSNQKYRPTTLGESGDGSPKASDGDVNDEEEHKPPVEQEIQTLHAEVKQDVKTVDLMERKMAIDMVKDKLRLIREMKMLSTMDIYSMDFEELSLADDLTPRKSPLNKGSLSPVQRTEALSAVKTRLHEIRESRKNGTHFFPAQSQQTQASSKSELKEIDGSPTHYVSQKASNLFQRVNSQNQAPQEKKTPSPSNSGSGLDMLRNFSLKLPKDPSEEGPKPGAFSPRTSNTLNQGIGALRSLSLNTTNDENAVAPWLGMTNNKSTVAMSPETPLPTASAASF